MKHPDTRPKVKDDTLFAFHECNIGIKTTRERFVAGSKYILNRWKNLGLYPKETEVIDLIPPRRKLPTIKGLNVNQ